MERDDVIQYLGVIRKDRDRLRTENERLRRSAGVELSEENDFLIEENQQLQATIKELRAENERLKGSQP